jgi:hypothetical protein
LDIQLCTPLLRLSCIVLALSLELCLTVTSDSGNGSAQSASDTVRHTGTQVVELALGFLSSAAGILFLTLLF